MLKNSIHQLDKITKIEISILVISLGLLFWVASGKIVSFLITKLEVNQAYLLLYFSVFILFALSEIPLLTKKLFSSTENSLLLSLPMSYTEFLYARFIEKMFANFSFLFVNIVNSLNFWRVARLPSFAIFFWLIGILLSLPILTLTQFLLTIACRSVTLRVRPKLIVRGSQVTQNSSTWTRINTLLSPLGQDILRPLVTKDIVLLLRQSFKGVIILTFILLGLLFFCVLHAGEWRTSILISLVINGILFFIWAMIVFDQTGKELPCFWLLKVLPVGWRKLWIGKFVFMLYFIFIIASITAGFFIISGTPFYYILLSFLAVLLIGAFISYFAVAFLFIDKDNLKLGQIGYVFFLIISLSLASVLPLLLVFLIPTGVMMFKRGTKCSL